MYQFVNMIHETDELVSKKTYKISIITQKLTFLITPLPKKENFVALASKSVFCVRKKNFQSQKLTHHFYKLVNYNPERALLNVPMMGGPAKKT